MEITYKTNYIPTTIQIIDLYRKTDMPRPTTDGKRIREMFTNSSVTISAWDGDKLVGVCRSITDWVWCCYLSDLAVNPDYKKLGIGRKLIEHTKAKVGEQCMIILISVPTALQYYPKVGFTKEDNSFIIKRTK